MTGGHWTIVIERQNRMKPKFIAMMVMVAGACFAAAPAKTAAAKPPADPNPYAGYGRAMASKKGNPMAVEWQAQNKAALAAATSEKELVCFVRDSASADALLAEVKPGYATDPLKACQIAAVSQFVMRPGWENARSIWTDALIKAFRSAKDDSVIVTYLDQLRWCGYAKHASAVKLLGAASSSKTVRDFAAMVARELEK